MMARRKQRARRPRADVPAPEASSQGDAGVAFVRFWVSRCEMSEVTKLEPPSDQPAANRVAIEVTVAAGVKTSPDGPAFSILSVAAKGDPRYRPYEVTVEVVGEFVAEQSPQADLIAFCKEVAPTILFPYARQIIDRMTSDGRFGALRINPLNVRAMLSQNMWQKNPTNPSEHANATRQPSSRSRSASRA